MPKARIISIYDPNVCPRMAGVRAAVRYNLATEERVRRAFRLPWWVVVGFIVGGVFGAIIINRLLELGFLGGSK